MIISCINNSPGTSKTTLLYALVTYLKVTENKKLQIFDLYKNELYLESSNLKDIYNRIENYEFPLRNKNNSNVYSYYSKLYEDKKNYVFFDTSKEITKNEYFLFLFSKAIIIPWYDSSYYNNNYIELIKLIKFKYEQTFINNPNLPQTIKELPKLLLVGVFYKISDDTIKIVNDLYSVGFDDVISIDNIFPVIDFNKIHDLNYLHRLSRNVIEEIINTLLAF